MAVTDYNFISFLVYDSYATLSVVICSGFIV